MMITKTLSALTESTKGLLKPAHKLNHQAITAIEKVAAEVRNVEDLQHLVTKQPVVLREVGDRWMSDFKAFFQIGGDFVSLSSKRDAEAADAVVAKVA